ncbi:MAG: hypothetical protein IPP08_11945 [Chlorobiota bacterium]|nr:hypothetical protein [Chlorobiota bacterium]QQS66453.1 MAG: hypothetical protein IPP08_11945 [Chlorobiota bacterium]
MKYNVIIHITKHEQSVGSVILSSHNSQVPQPNEILYSTIIGQYTESGQGWRKATTSQYHLFSWQSTQALGGGYVGLSIFANVLFFRIV